MKILKYALSFFLVFSVLIVPFSVSASSDVSSDSSNIWEFSAPAYSDFDASDSYNFYRAQKLVESNAPFYNIFDKYLICNVQNKHFTTSYSYNATSLDSASNNVLYTVLLFQSRSGYSLNYTSSYNTNNLLTLKANAYVSGVEKSQLWFGYITLSSTGYTLYNATNSSFNSGLGVNNAVTFCQNDIFGANACFFGFDSGSDAVLLENICSGYIYKDGVHIFEPNFFQTARVLRKTLSPILPEIVPVGILVLCSVVLLVVFLRWRRSLLRAFRV